MSLFKKEKKEEKNDFLIPDGKELHKAKVEKRLKGLGQFADKYGLDKKDAEIIGQMLEDETGLFSGSASALKGEHQRILIIQNWIIIKKLDELIKKLDKK